MSRESIEFVCGETEQFLEKLKSRGWLANDELFSFDARSASDLFQTSLSRPLVVGFFGGTGVGKSSLLNRLAGDDIARTGVVRPTSLEITAYLHGSCQVYALPDRFLVSNFNSVEHQNDKFKDVMWVDMPDFDSDETQNREQVLQWIPHIDVLVYVVTPERYRDEQGWQLLVSEGYRHGWLFVMNQWDKADLSQMDDFVQLLKRTGFERPRVFKTLGIETSADTDEFEQFATLIATLAERNVVEQLVEVGWFRRLEHARNLLKQHLQVLGSPEHDIVDLFDATWMQACDRVAANLNLPISQYAAGFAPSQSSPLKNALISVFENKHGEKTKYTALAQNAETVLDSWSRVTLDDAVVEFELAVKEHGIPRSRLARLSADSGGVNTSVIGQQWSKRVLHAIVNPGAAWQRSLQTVLGWAAVGLPLGAVAWVAGRVLSGFIDGAENPGAYVGPELLTNGVMLVIIAWGLPWLAGLLTKPSVPKAITHALLDQLQRDMTAVSVGYRTELARIVDERDTLKLQAESLMERISGTLARSSILQTEDVRELLIQTPPR